MSNICEIHNQKMYGQIDDIKFGSDTIFKPESLEKVVYKCAQCENDEKQAKIATITNIDSIDGMCYQSFPCQHHISTPQGLFFLGALQIIEICEKLGKPVDSHFSKQKDAYEDS